MTTQASSRNGTATGSDPGNDYLGLVGDRVRNIRARRGMTRKILSRDSGVSERYLAELENGRGNISIMLLRQIAEAMHVPIDELVREGPDLPIELSLILEQLRRLDAGALNALHHQLQDQLGASRSRGDRIALIGLRGAGKSTLGQALADRLQVPFVQLNKEIEAEAGMSLSEVFDLFGQAAFRRLERQCLERVVDGHEQVVIEAGGSLVSEPATFERLLSACFTVWLQAAPEEHMNRVLAQGDHRPMAGNREAMTDLRRILDGRTALYGKADAVVVTSGRSIDDCVDELAALRRRDTRAR